MTIMVRGGHEVVLQGVADQDAERLVQRFTELFDQTVPSGSTITSDGTVLRNSQVVGVRSISEQELTSRAGRRP